MFEKLKYVHTHIIDQARGDSSGTLSFEFCQMNGSAQLGAPKCIWESFAAFSCCMSSVYSNQLKLIYCSCQVGLPLNLHGLMMPFTHLSSLLPYSKRSYSIWLSCAVIYQYHQRHIHVRSLSHFHPTSWK